MFSGQCSINLSDDFLAKFLTKFLARVLARVLGGGKSEKAINTVYSTIRPKENTFETTTKNI